MNDVIRKDAWDLLLDVSRTRRYYDHLIKKWSGIWSPSLIRVVLLVSATGTFASVMLSWPTWLVLSFTLVIGIVAAFDAIYNPSRDIELLRVINQDLVHLDNECHRFGHRYKAEQ